MSAVPTGWTISIGDCGHVHIASPTGKHITVGPIAQPRAEASQLLRELAIALVGTLDPTDEETTP